MKKIYLTLATGLLAIAMNAQQYVHQVIFLNEGSYDYNNQTQVAPVTLGVYNPATNIYTEFDTVLNARFGSDIAIDDGNIYIAADSFLLVYDKNTLQKTATAIVTGIRKIALWNDRILVTRGDVVPFNSYFHIYDKANLSLVYEMDSQTGPAYASEGISVIGDTAYIAIGNGFDWGNEVGKLGIVDLNNQLYKDEIDFGTEAKNPDNMMVEGNNIYLLNNKDWNGSSVSLFNIITRDTSVVNIAAGSGCGSSALAASHIYYMEYNVGKLARFDVTSKTIMDTLQNTMDFYGLANDETNDIMYATTTDYFSSGKAYKMQYNGALVDSFDVGVSAGTIAMDVRTAVGIANSTFNNLQFTIYPNPNNGNFTLETQVTGDLKVYNLLGEVVYSDKISKNLNLNIPWGIYFVELKTEQGIAIEKLIKQ